MRYTRIVTVAMIAACLGPSSAAALEHESRPVAARILFDMANKWGWCQPNLPMDMDPQLVAGKYISCNLADDDGDGIPNYREPWTAGGRWRGALVPLAVDLPLGADLAGLGIRLHYALVDARVLGGGKQQPEAASIVVWRRDASGERSAATVPEKGDVVPPGVVIPISSIITEGQCRFFIEGVGPSAAVGDGGIKLELVRDAGANRSAVVFSGVVRYTNVRPALEPRVTLAEDRHSVVFTIRNISDRTMMLALPGFGPCPLHIRNKAGRYREVRLFREPPIWTELKQGESTAWTRPLEWLRGLADLGDGPLDVLWQVGQIVHDGESDALAGSVVSPCLRIPAVGE